MSEQNEVLEIKLEKGESPEEAIAKRFGLVPTPPEEMPDDADVEGTVEIKFV